MAILQQTNAVFYHPLDTLTEALQTQAWVGSATFGAAKVGLGLGAGGNTIASFGTKTVFNTSLTNDTSVAALTPTSFVVAYGDPADSNLGKVVIGTLTGTTLTFGSQVVFSAGNIVSDISVIALTPTSFVVVYTKGLGGFGFAVAGTVTGTTSTFGNQKNLWAGPTFDVSATALTSTTFVTSLFTNPNGRAIVGTVTGTTITLGTDTVFSTTTVAFTSTSALTSASFVVIYKDSGNIGTAIIGTVAGTMLTFGSSVVFSATNLFSISVTAMTSTSFVVVYEDLGNSNFGTAIIGTVIGSAVTFGTKTTFSGTATASIISVATFTPASFVITYLAGGSSGTAIIGTVEGTTTAFGAAAPFNVGLSGKTSVAALTPTLFVIGSRDSLNASWGTAIVGTVVTPSLSGNTTSYPTGAGATRLAFSTWSRSSGLSPAAQLTGPPPQFFTETDRNILTAMGVPASRLGGFT